MRKTTIFIVVIFLGALAAAPAFGQGFYVGAGIGNTFFSDSYKDAFDQAKEIDENSTTWKIFGGFSGPGFLAVEGGYRDFGKVDIEGFEQKTKGFDVEAVGRFQIAIVDVFGKAGLMFWNWDGKIGDLEFDGNGTNFMWGLGAGVRLGSIGVRLEWESLEVDGPNMSMVSLGATLGF